MAKGGYTIKGSTIVINRDLTELDIFVKKFLEILIKHSDYLIVSGYVSICTGRARGTEDVDIIVPVMTEEAFKQLFIELQQHDFWCYQGDTADKAYGYMASLHSLRFALENEIFPNVELIPFNETKPTKVFEFQHPQKIKISNFEFRIPPLEFEILYKELVPGSDKDIADARYLRGFFSEILKEENFIKYKPIIIHEQR